MYSWFRELHPKEKPPNCHLILSDGHRSAFCPLLLLLLLQPAACSSLYGKLWSSQTLLSQVSCVREKPQGERPTLMAISQDLLEILACPACKAKVEMKPDGSGLKCVECRRVYPIRDDIPVMLVDEATIENGTEDQQSQKS
jgi:uncharacterized protein YbaR (Trm112 family)